MSARHNEAMWQVLPSSESELGESPFWHPHERALYWLDIPGRAVLRTRGDIGAATVERWPLPTEPGCMAPARSGGLVIALRDGIYRARDWGGALRPLAMVDHDTRTMRFNDGKCDAQGRFWAGSINEAKDGATAALYCLDPSAGKPATLRRMADGVTTANGLAFAPESRRLYWSDTAAHVVRRWQWDAATNAMSDMAVFRRFDDKPAGWTAEAPGSYAGRPDGATLDAAGNYWAAMFEGAQVKQLAPDGHTLAAFPLPARCPTMPCFGGDDLRTLFVTTGRRGRPLHELSHYPASGSVMFMQAAQPGRPVDFFND